VKIVPLATLCKNRLLIFYTSVNSLLESGRRSLRGVVFITCLQRFGPVNHPQTHGGPKQALQRGKGRKMMASMIMLISCEIWMEQNARVYCDTFSTASNVITRIKEEAEASTVGGARGSLLLKLQWLVLGNCSNNLILID
jgi:hypothetical protein